MPRNVDVATLNALASGVVNIGILADIALTTGPIYCWTGYGNLTYNGNTYLGLGNMSDISPSSESSVVIAQGLSLTLTGIGSDISEALTDITQGQPVTLYMVVLDAAGNIIGSPITTYQGQTDTVQVIDDPNGTCTVVLQVENRLTQLQRNRAYRWTNAQMQELNPAEQGFMYTANLSDYVAEWGNNGDGVGK